MYKDSFELHFKRRRADHVTNMTGKLIMRLRLTTRDQPNVKNIEEYDSKVYSNRGCLCHYTAKNVEIACNV